MGNLKITQLLKSLSPVEFKNLGKFINSPFHNESHLIIELYKILKKIYPDFSNPHYTREYIFKHLYPGEQYDEHKIRDRFSEFVKLTEKFLVYSSIEEDRLGHHIRFLESCKKKNINTIFEKEINEVLQNLNTQELKDESYFKRLYEVRELYWDYRLSRHLAGSTDILEDLLLEAEDLKNFFIIKILKIYLSYISGRGIVNFNYSFTLFGEVMKYLDKEIENFKEVPLIYVLYHFLQLYLKREEDNTYERLKKIVQENEKYIDKQFLEVLYVELINYCKSEEEKGKSEFGFESLNLMKYMLKLGLLFESDNTMHIQNYTGIVSSALRLNDITWAEEFINEYKNYLLPEFRENTYLYNMSTLFYVKWKNNTVKNKELLNISLDYLSKVKCMDFYDKVRVFNHQLVLYYEMEYVDELISLIDSYRHYLSSNVLIPEDQKERYHCFINFLARVVKLLEGSERINISRLIEEIKSAPDCENRKWLLSKIDDILKKKNLRILNKSLY